jgi:hypothetical protein
MKKPVLFLTSLLVAAMLPASAARADLTLVAEGQGKAIIDAHEVQAAEAAEK